MSRELEGARKGASKLNSALAQANKTIEEMAEAHKAEVEDLTQKLEDVSAKLRKHLSGGMTFTPAPQSWEEALAACENDYVKAARAYPELQKEYIQRNKGKVRTG